MKSKFGVISALTALLLFPALLGTPVQAYPTDTVKPIKIEQAQSLREFNIMLGASEATGNRLAETYISDGTVMSMSSASPVSAFSFVENSQTFIVSKFADGSAILEQYPFVIQTDVPIRQLSNSTIYASTLDHPLLTSLRSFDKCDSFSQGQGWSGGIGCPFSVSNGIVSVGLQIDFTGVGNSYGSTISNPRAPWVRSVGTNCSYPQITQHVQKHTASGPASVTLATQCGNTATSSTYYAQFTHAYARFSQRIW